MNRDTLFEKMKLAVEQEYEAYHLYKEISEKSGDPELQVIFERIAKEE
jgi:rubrerythrin